MDYAVIKTGGKQYRVAAGDIIEVEKLAGNTGDVISFQEVLMLRQAENVTLGTPIIAGLTVSGKVVEQFKNDKIRVSKYKAKVRHRRTIGHRQQLTRVQIDVIGASKKISSEKKVAAKVSKPAVKKTA